MPVTSTPLLRLDDQRVVVLLDRLARQQDRLDQVIDLGAGADADQVRPDLPAGTGDRVTFQTDHVGPAEDPLAAGRIAVLGHVLNHLLHLGGAQLRAVRCRGCRPSSARRPGRALRGPRSVPCARRPWPRRRAASCRPAPSPAAAAPFFRSRKLANTSRRDRRPVVGREHIGSESAAASRSRPARAITARRRRASGSLLGPAPRTPRGSPCRRAAPGLEGRLPQLVTASARAQPVPAAAAAPPRCPIAPRRGPRRRGGRGCSR